MSFSKQMALNLHLLYQHVPFHGNSMTTDGYGAFLRRQALLQQRRQKQYVQRAVRPDLVSHRVWLAVCGFLQDMTQSVGRADRRFRSCYLTAAVKYSIKFSACRSWKCKVHLCE